MSDSDGSWLENALKLNSQRRRQRFAELKAQGAAWMLECRDLWDSEDDDAGVYFSGFVSSAQVVAALKALEKNDSERLLGIYDLAQPLESQGPGMTKVQWLASQR